MRGQRVVAIPGVRGTSMASFVIEQALLVGPAVYVPVRRDQPVGA